MCTCSTGLIWITRQHEVTRRGKLEKYDILQFCMKQKPRLLLQGVCFLRDGEAKQCNLRNERAAQFRYRVSLPATTTNRAVLVPPTEDTEDLLSALFLLNDLKQSSGVTLCEFFKAGPDYLSLVPDPFTCQNQQSCHWHSWSGH